MTKSEFAPIVQLLRGAFNMLADTDAQSVWLYNLQEFRSDDVREACDHIIRTSSSRPSIADMINETRRVRGERRTRELSALAESGYGGGGGGANKDAYGGVNRDAYGGVNRDASGGSNYVNQRIRPGGSSGRCPVCRNSGLVIREIEGGYEVGRPCTACAFGRLNYPGYFAEAERAEEMKAAARTEAVRDADVRDATVVAEPAAFTASNVARAAGPNRSESADARREMDARREAAAYTAPATFTASNVARAADHNASRGISLNAPQAADPKETGSDEQISLQFDVAERLAYRAAG